MAGLFEVVEKVRALMPEVTHVVGEEHLVSQYLPAGRSVVWIVSGDVFGPARANHRPAARLTRTEAVQVACWGVGPGTARTAEDDMKAARELADAVLFALEDGMAGSYRVSSGSWQANAPKAQLGRMYVLALELDSPVTRPEARVTVTAVVPETELAPASE